jgi:hypothetical protein
MVQSFLDNLDNKERTAVRLALQGTINLSTNAALEEVLSRSRDIFAALEVSERRSGLVVIPDNDDLTSLELSGFAQDALEELAALSKEGSSDKAQVATDALMLLRRLAQSAS